MGITNFDRVQANLFIGPTVDANPFGQFFYVDAVTGSDENDGSGPDSAFATLTEALTRVVDGRGDVIYQFGFSDESVILPRTKNNLTIIGTGGRGASGIACTSTGEGGLLVHADDVTLINFGVAGESTAGYALAGTGSRFRAYGCKFEGVDTTGAAFAWGPGSVANVTAGIEGKGGDINLYDCEFAWSYDGILFVASDYGACTQILVDTPSFHNISHVELFGNPGAFGIGSVRNLNVRDGIWGCMEDGTAPADFVNIQDTADTGIFSGNRFALPTNDSGELKIGTSILWSANATEAGWSTARPS